MIPLPTMYRLLATDIDDTLIDEHQNLPEVNRRVLAALHEHGVRIVFCSGRADVSIQRIASRILEPADDEYYIAFNGARVVTAGSRREIAAGAVSPEAVSAVVAYARRHGLYLQGYEGDEFLLEQVTEHTERYAQATGMTYRCVPDLVEALPRGSSKLLLIGSPEMLEPHALPLERASGCTTFFSKPHYLETVRRHVNKGSALRALAEKLSIPIEQTIAIGDSTNDVAMLEAAGLGLAVHGARREAAAAADIVLKRSASEGVLGEVAERFFAELGLH